MTRILSLVTLGSREPQTSLLASWLFVDASVYFDIINRSIQHSLILRETGLQYYVEGRGGGGVAGGRRNGERG